MNINEVRIKMVASGPDKLQAFCSITIDNSFVVRDLKVIEGAKGYFVAMPSRKLTDRCPRCDGKNHLRARFCNNCGARLPEDRAEKDSFGKARLHVDIAHPINSACREKIQEEVLAAFHEELKRAREPGYEHAEIPYDEYGDGKKSDKSFHLSEKEPKTEAGDNFGKGLF